MQSTSKIFQWLNRFLPLQFNGASSWLFSSTKQGPRHRRVGFILQPYSSHRQHFHHPLQKHGRTYHEKVFTCLRKERNIRLALEARAAKFAVQLHSRISSRIWPGFEIDHWAAIMEFIYPSHLASILLQKIFKSKKDEYRQKWLVTRIQR